MSVHSIAVLKADSTADLAGIQQDAVVFINNQRWYYDTVLSIWRVNGIKTGTIMIWSSGNLPSDTLWCNGDPVSRATYAALFAEIGTVFGVGDNSTTFNVPDLRQRFPMGKAASGTGATMGTTGGAVDHLHTVPGQTVNSGNNNAVQNNVTLLALGAAAANPHTHSVTIAGVNSGTNNPPYQVVDFIIKT